MASLEPRDRHLPAGMPIIGVPSRDAFGGGHKRPPEYATLAVAGLLAPLSDPWKFFDRRERVIAEFMLDAGVPVRAVTEGVFPTPDAVIDELGVTVEFKTLDAGAVNPAGALYQRIRHARTQSRRVVVDVRESSATRKDANQAVVRALRNGGHDLSEVVVIGGGFVLSWP